MSSCYKKKINVEKYASPPRTPYDQTMNNMYNNSLYHAAPFPMEKTRYDAVFQKLYCPHCGYTDSKNYNGCNSFKIVNPPPIKKHNSEPVSLAELPEYFSYPRTPYDQNMKNMYSPDTYFAAPFPMEKTRYDMNFQELHCPNCKKYFKSVNPPSEKNNNFKDWEIPSRVYEGYNGGGCSIKKSLPDLSLDDNDNPWSYNSYRY